MDTSTIDAWMKKHPAPTEPPAQEREKKLREPLPRPPSPAETASRIGCWYRGSTGGKGHDMGRFKAALLVVGLGVLSTPLPASASHPLGPMPDADCTPVPIVPAPPGPVAEPIGHTTSLDGECNYYYGPD